MFFTMLTFIINTFYYSFSFLYYLLSFCHAVLPFGLDIGLVGYAAYYLTKLKKPEPENVISIFGPDPWGKESQYKPEKVVRCIAHRGAALDAPENTMEALKYVKLDVRASRDGKLVLLHDEGLERLTGTDISSIRTVDWERIKDIDVGATHPNSFTNVKPTTFPYTASPDTLASSAGIFAPTSSSSEAGVLWTSVVVTSEGSTHIKTHPDIHKTVSRCSIERLPFPGRVKDGV
ncbi:hypothetical protein HF086_009762 [Spodoptera exigua]|uniref:GP-PDE domain-containing protein n=1 Tax=Spodoptera exigua TaxID=7107 RepID=A0A922SD09_SPOEX|nr:hypothetical protein HF086_009762 [Spodoptera exigua]